MTKLREYTRETITRGGDAVGGVYAITGLAAQTVTVGQLARGEMAEKYRNRWMTRREASAGNVADRIRLVSGFTGSTGVFDQTGAAYGDTTVGSELVELTRNEFDPLLIDQAVNRAIKFMRRNYEIEMPTHHGSFFPLTDFSWITGMGEFLVPRVTFKASPVLTRNRHFRNWFGVDTSGRLTPDFWELSAAGVATRLSRTALAANSSMPSEAYLCRVTSAAGEDVWIAQSVPVMSRGVTGQTLAGQTVSGVGRVTTTLTDAVVQILVNGAVVATSSASTGTGRPQELSVSTTLAATASNVTVRGFGSTTGNYDWEDLYNMHGTVSDQVRADNYPEESVNPRPSQNGQLGLVLPARGFGGQYIVWSARPYPGFDGTRLAAGTVDIPASGSADEQDAPLIPVAYGALAYLYRGLAESGTSGNAAQYAQNAAQHWATFQNLAAQHIAVDTPSGGGIELPRTFFPQPRRSAS